MRGANVWAVVAMVVAALAAVTTAAVTGTETTAILQVIATAVVPTVTILLVGRHIASRVSDVEHEVNGRMTELINKVPDPLNAAPERKE